MRLKGGADDKIYYYDFYDNTWVVGNIEEEYIASIKYNDDTEDIANEVASVISELIEKGVINKDKIKTINIDVINNHEHKIGNNFKIYWSQNDDMITVGCEYNGDCAVHQANKIVREVNAAKKEADAAGNALVDAMKKVDDALEYADAARKEVYDALKEEDIETFKLIPSPNANTNTNETKYEEFIKEINKMTDQAYMDIDAYFEAAKNKSFNDENELAEKIDQEFDNYLYAYKRNEAKYPITTFEKYIETFSTDKEKLLDYLKNNSNYLDELIANKEGVQWQTELNGKHRLVATTVNDDLI